jgi:hypothetical protein
VAFASTAFFLMVGRSVFSAMQENYNTAGHVEKQQHNLIGSYHAKTHDTCSNSSREKIKILN